GCGLIHSPPWLRDWLEPSPVESIERPDVDHVLENAEVALQRVGADGEILWANRAQLDLIGYPHDEYVGKNLLDFQVDRPALKEVLAKLGRGERIRDFEARLRRRGGAIRYVIISANVLWREGKFMHSRCVTRDITERQHAEEALRETDERFRLLVEGVRDYAIFMLSPEGRVISWNDGAQRITGYGADEILGHSYSCLFPPDEAPRAARELR